jgi:drug/metabolite transporter (DMT)-like permease
MHTLVALLCANVIWSLNYIVAKHTLVHVPPLALAAVRTPLSALLLFASLRPLGAPFLVEGQNWKLLGLLGLATAGNQLFFIEGLQHTTPAHSALIAATMPLVLAVAARVRLKEAFGWAKALGLLTSFSGVAILVLSRSAANGRAVPTALGDLLSVLGVIFLSVYFVGGKELFSRYNMPTPTATAWSQAMAVPWVLSLCASSAVQVPWLTLGAATWAGIAYIVVLNSVVGFLLYYYALSRLPASRVAAFNYLQAPLTTVASIALGYEHATWTAAFGGGLVLSGLLIADRAGTSTPKAEPTS